MDENVANVVAFIIIASCYKQFAAVMALNAA
jgi:hypothetical protein